MSDNQKMLVVTIAHDYLCPWCWVGFFHAQRLNQEFPQIQQDWRGYELLPEELGPLPDYKPHPRDPSQPPTRFEAFAEAEGHPVPEGRTIGVIRTHNALEGAEFVKEHAPDCFDRYNEAVYRAFWERSEDISDLDVLGSIAHNAGVEKEPFIEAIRAKQYHHKIVRFDADAYADDITHVPTFKFRGERCAEAPYTTIREMAERFLIWYDKH
jgi:predicted DsbA family dithiol-disulfide isomerase